VPRLWPIRRMGPEGRRFRRNGAVVSWQDPSADIANVNAAYRVERDENRRLREALTAIRDGDYCSGARNIASAALGQKDGGS
jgi:hypothetical protein